MHVSIYYWRFKDVSAGPVLFEEGVVVLHGVIWGQKKEVMQMSYLLTRCCVFTTSLVVHGDHLAARHPEKSWVIV